MFRERIAVVGGGLVGSLWATLLRRKGMEVDLFEKRSDMRRESAEGGRSINLVVTSRGIHGLEKAGLLSALDLAVPVYGRQIHAKDGGSVFQPYGKPSECNYSISRSGLNRFLLDAAEQAGVRLHFNQALEKIDFQTKHLVFAPGSPTPRATYDRLFGTDGAGSAVRRRMVESFPACKDSVDWLEADYKELHLPAGPGGKSLLAQNALHIWPRGTLMMMALANRDGSFTVTLYMPKAEGAAPSFQHARSGDSVRELFETQFPDAVPLMPNYIEEYLANPQGALGTVRCTCWVHGEAALLGDAAHAIVPFFGQGMNLGFEDCTTLLALWEKHQNWDAALEAFDSVQRPNANAIADMALENWVEMRDKVGDARFLLRKKVEAKLEETFPAIYKSRYGLIAYTLVPYAVAQEAGKVQDRILGKLIEGLDSVDRLDLKKAEELLRREFVPFLENNRFELGAKP